MAKRFQFRLEQVLRLRRQLEEIKVRELSVAKNRLLEVEKALGDQVEKRDQFLMVRGELEKEGIFTSQEVMAYCDYQQTLLAEEKAFRQRQSDWMLEVERRRREVVKVSRERELLDRLKDKKKRIYDQETNHDEQKFLDDVSSIAFVRRERAKRLVGLS